MTLPPQIMLWVWTEAQNSECIDQSFFEVYGHALISVKERDLLKHWSDGTGPLLWCRKLSDASLCIQC